MAKQVEIILAATRRGEIGFKGTIPWKLDGDLKRFKELTMGNVVIMGRKTVESLPGPLPGRKLIVVSENMGKRIELGEHTDADSHFISLFQVDDVVKSLSDAIELAQVEAFYPDARSIFIAGGAGIYAEAIPLADILHLTGVFPQGDVEYDAIIPNFSDLIGEHFNVGHLGFVPCPLEFNQHHTYCRYTRALVSEARDLNPTPSWPVEMIKVITTSGRPVLVKPSFIHIHVDPKVTREEVLALIKSTPNPGNLPFKLFPEPTWFDDLFEK